MQVFPGSREYSLLEKIMTVRGTLGGKDQKHKDRHSRVTVRGCTGAPRCFSMKANSLSWALITAYLHRGMGEC